MPDLLVIGDCFIDQHLNIESTDVYTDESSKEARFCFFHGSKIPVKEYKTTFGGNAAHICTGAQRLGLSASIYTELGDDMYAEQILKRFRDEGIDTQHCKENKGTSTNTSVIVIFDQERTIFNYHVPRKYGLDFNKIKKPKWLFYTSLSHGFEEFQPKLIEYLKDNPDIGVAFNPGSIHLKNLDKLKDFYGHVDVLFVNKQEAHLMTGLHDENDVNVLHSKLHEMGIKLSVITDGKNGSTAYDGKEYDSVDAPQVRSVVDKTGSGDAYAAAFLSALHYKKKIKEAMLWGNKNAASIVQEIGALDGLLTRKEMEGR